MKRSRLHAEKDLVIPEELPKGLAHTVVKENKQTIETSCRVDLL
jgi:hypothetical protein